MTTKATPPRPLRVSALLAPVLIALLAPSASVAEGGAPGSSEVLAITHVNVVPMDAERVLEDQTVLVTKGTIFALGHAREVVIPPGAARVEGRGRYLMPGLADLHVHLFSPDDLLAYVAAGVTTVANMDGSPAHLKWRDQVRAGALVGPTIFTAGHTIDGVPPLNEMFLTAETAEAARAIVAEQKRAGYDMVKVYGTLRPEVYRAILQAGEDARIPVVGHVNRQVGALAVLKSSQALAAHLEDLLFARFDRPPSDAELVEFADAIAASSLTVTPNLNTGPMSIAQIRDLGAVLSSSEARLLSPAAYSQWMPANNRNERGANGQRQVEMLEGVQGILRRLTRLLSSRGVRLVAGSDASAYGIPGSSLHQELQELVKAGLSPYEALLTATRNSGEFLAEKVAPLPRRGTVTMGSVADLVLLSANPLQDIGNAARVEGVWLRGRWLSATDLKARASAASTRFDEEKRRLDEIDAFLEAGDEPRAAKAGVGLGSDGSPWIAEWV
ncbi:MAG TPA: amidohydrolase family protein, partial [Vicinamibacteria bacterium]